MGSLKESLKPAVFSARTLLARAKGRLIGKSVKAFLVSTQQGLFLVDPQDSGVGGSLLHRGKYAQDEIDRICALTNAESSVLFVGSHIGSLVIPVSRKVKRVTAIEANPNTFDLLTWNTLLNRCDNVTTIELAASDEAGELEFVASRINSGGSKRMPLVKSFVYFYDKPAIIKVKSARLDDRLAEDFDVIVMDIEGSEYFALKGMNRILSRAKNLIVEFIPHHLKGVSGITVAQLLELIEPHFESLRIPSKSLTVDRSQFLPTLQKMYDLNEWDESMIFSKA
jgi:FkbM family methyltransferase